MPITPFDHQHDPALVLQGVDRELIIQTGTIILDFRSSDEGSWSRDRLTQPVFVLPSGGVPRHVQAIASAAPASMSYAPRPAAGATGGEGGTLVAQGTVGFFGRADDFGGVQVGGSISLPVTGSAPVTVRVLPAGWAVDRTRAVRSGNQIELVVDLAVLGPSSLLRLAYSLFVTISPDTIGDDPITVHHEP